MLLRNCKFLIRRSRGVTRRHGVTSRRHVFSIGCNAKSVVSMCFQSVPIFLTFSIGSHAKHDFPSVLHRLPRKTYVVIVFSMVPTQHLYCPCVFHRFQRKTYDLFPFSIGSHAKPDFPCVFKWFPRNTCVFLVFSTRSHATPVLSIRFPTVPIQNLCVFLRVQ